ncbi:hypothetical protein Zmor_009259 [Zophobas morio]|uniref:Uncharacterized protein n=1 Tax=Zophobas morio TaxID=2755281 RepID=A0AA38MIJ0_9CUCU|nr:hypothetical protein Zmor_009259 [Zophobas morio]
MSRSKFGVILFLFLSCGVSVGLKCFFCSVFLTPRYINDDQIHCNHPAQWHCLNVYDNCVSLIYNNLMTKRCVSLNATDTFLIMWLCNQTQLLNPRNCQLCTTSLCNSGRTRQGNVKTILMLLSTITIFYFLT